MSYQKVRFQEKVKEVVTDLIDGTECVYLDDVQMVFRRVTWLSLNGQPLPFIRDKKSGERMKPLRVKARPDEVIDGEQSENDVAENSAVTLVGIGQTVSEIKQTVCEINQKSDTALENQQVLIARTKAIFKQAYELTEYNVPRLFIVLPEKSFKLDPRNVAQARCRLIFFCEGREDKEVHFALHEGYLIKQPKQFFSKYGSLLRNMIPYIKAALFIAGFAVPVLGNVAPNIQIPDFLKEEDAATKLSKKLDDMSDFLDGLLRDKISSTTQNRQPVEGVDLREIKTFLDKRDSEEIYGNLFRIVTDEGQVRWVCLHHHNEYYVGNRQPDLIKRLEKIGGEYKKETAAALVKVPTMTSDNVLTICSIIKDGLKLYSLKLDRCKMPGSSFDSLLTVIRCNSILKMLELRHVTLTTLGIRRQEMLVYEKVKKSLSDKRNLIDKRNFELKVIVISDDFRWLLSTKLLVKCTGLNPDDSSLVSFNFHHTDDSDSIEYVEYREDRYSFGKCLLDDTILMGIVEKESGIMAVQGILTENVLHKMNSLLQKNSKLETLVFYSCDLKFDAIRALEILVMSITSITKLCFIHCAPRLRKVIPSLANLLRKNYSLRELVMCSSYIKATEAAVLFKALETNTLLEKLNLADNDIIFENIKTICNYLKVNNTLLSLNLSNNYVVGNFYNDVLEILHGNTALKQLYLKETSLEPNHILTILEYLQRNKTLETIDLRQEYKWMITKKHAAILQKVCDENQTIKKIKLNLDYQAEEIRQSIERLTVIDTS